MMISTVSPSQNMNWSHAVILGQQKWNFDAWKRSSNFATLSFDVPRQMHDLKNSYRDWVTVESAPRSCATLDCQPCKMGKPSCKHISFVHSICGAHYGSNVNRKVGVPKRNQVEQLWLNIKTEVWKFDERPKNVVSGYTTNCSNGLNFASKQIMHKSCPHKLKWRLCFLHPKNGNPRVIFVHELWLRRLKSLFDWGHLFVICVARGKFCKSMKFRF